MIQEVAEDNLFNLFELLSRPLLLFHPPFISVLLLCFDCIFEKVRKPSIKYGEWHARPVQILLVPKDDYNVCSWYVYSQYTMRSIQCMLLNVYYQRITHRGRRHAFTVCTRVWILVLYDPWGLLGATCLSPRITSLGTSEPFHQTCHTIITRPSIVIIAPQELALKSNTSSSVGLPQCLRIHSDLPHCSIWEMNTITGQNK